MASDAEWALGDHVEMGDGATPVEAFTRLPEVRNMVFALGSRTRVDTSSMDSTPPDRDDITTFREPGTINIDGNYLPDNAIQQDWEDKVLDNAKTTFRVVFEADGGNVVWQGKGRLLNFTPTSNFEDARRFTAQIATTGAWTRVQGS